MIPSLRLVHRFGTPQALTPDKDKELKGTLAATMVGNRLMTWTTIRDVMDKDTFVKLNAGEAMGVDRMETILRESDPPTMKAMNPAVRNHCEYLNTQFDMIDRDHRPAAETLTAWIVKNYKPGQQLGIIVVCTGNTRRSMLGAAMGNIAASYYGLDVRFASGGTTPEALNPRTITTLKAIGVEIESTGKVAPRGPANQTNPIYRMAWGKGLEATEFSKVYTDAHNPQSGFAALLVCGEADDACPTVKGAALRLPVPYLDPKLYDGSALEAAKYAERRDDMGRFMLNVLMQSRRRLAEAGTFK